MTEARRDPANPCTVKNEAGGLIGGYEYKPDNDPGNRCVRTE